jgi:hypothetical protein
MAESSVKYIVTVCYYSSSSAGKRAVGQRTDYGC